MRITDLLNPKAVMVNTVLKSKDEAIDKLIELHEISGDLLDAEQYKKDILKREKQGSTAIGNGIAVPHAKSKAVKKASLSAVTVKGGVPYGAPDGKNSDLLFMIAAGDENDEHLTILSRLMTMLMDEHFVSALKNAKSTEDFLNIIDTKEAEKFGGDISGHSESHYRILAVTACPTGIAHTYMAAEALEKAAKKAGIEIKVETDGSGGTKNALTKEEIEKCDGIIVAADRNVETDRFSGKKVLITSVSAGINKPEELIERILSGDVPVYKKKSDGSSADTEYSEGNGFGKRIYKHLMNGVSHMLPFVVGGGVLIAFGFLADSISGVKAGDTLGYTTPVAAVIFWIGKAAFAFMLPILSGYISMSIADRPGLLVGFVGGYFASQGLTLASLCTNGLDGDSTAVSGFLGALIAGFLGGLIVNLLKKIFAFLPKSMDGIKPVFLYPLFGTLLIGLLMGVINPFIGILNTGLSNGLTALGGTSRVLLCTVLAAMMAVDMGGPFNKAAYVFGTAAIASGNYYIMAAVMIGGMIPPIAIALSTTFNKSKWTDEERRGGAVNYLMGLCFITEGAIPYAAADPLRVIPACIIGSGVAGALSGMFGCGIPAPHGGIFVFPVAEHIGGYIIALAAGSLAGALMLSLFKKRKSQKEVM